MKGMILLFNVQLIEFVHVLLQMMLFSLSHKLKVRTKTYHSSDVLRAGLAKDILLGILRGAFLQQCSPILIVIWSMHVKLS